MLHKMSKRIQGGFTLIELMIVVAIIGILAAVAIPAFMKYIKKSKTAEATQQVKKLSDGARTYYLEDRVQQGTGIAIAKQFPAGAGATDTGVGGPTPAANSCCGNPSDKCPVVVTDWNVEPWTSLKFGMTDPHYYWYTFDAAGNTAAAQYTARANGDLDCDTTNSTFEMYGTVSAEREPTTAGGMFTKNEIE
jgi:type IV pilus assembly protein PilA